MRKQSWKSPITVYELKRRNKVNGGHFFDRDTMKRNCETLKDFSLRRDVDPSMVILTRKHTGTKLRFNVETGRFLAG